MSKSNGVTEFNSFNPQVKNEVMFHKRFSLFSLQMTLSESVLLKINRNKEDFGTVLHICLTD